MVNYVDRDETPEKKKMIELQRALEDAKRDVSKSQDVVQKLYGVIVRFLVILKYVIRLGATGAVYLLLGRTDAMIFAFFLLLQGIMQLAIDKTRKVVHPELKLSEWDIDF